MINRKFNNIKPTRHYYTVFCQNVKHFGGLFFSFEKYFSGPFPKGLFDLILPLFKGFFPLSGRAHPSSGALSFSFAQDASGAYGISDADMQKIADTMMPQ